MDSHGMATRLGMMRCLSVGFRTVVGMISLSLLLAGCAGQMAYREGKQLVSQGKPEAGILKFQEALRTNPREPEYKSAYLQTRDRILMADLDLAGRLADSGTYAEAETVYQRALALDPTNERARGGLRGIETAKRHDKLATEARLEWERKDAQSAQLKVRAILTENPNHQRALALKGLIDEKGAEPRRDVALSAAFKKPISIEFKDVTVKQVFEVISRTAGLNFLFDKDVKVDQKTSIYLRNSTIEAAIDYTLLTNELERQILDGNTMLVYPNTVAKAKNYQQMVVKPFLLANADAKSVANTIKTIVKSHDIVIDEKLNMVIVRDTPEAIRLAEKLVALHDVADPEVMLEVEILEVSRNRLLDLGIDWPNSLALAPLPSSASGSLTLNDLGRINSRTIGASIAPVNISAGQDDSDTKVLANPRIRARNHEKAKILIGERVPNITTTATATGFVSETVNYIDVGLKLEVEPTIYLDNEVAIKVALEVSNITSQLQTKTGSVAYQIGTRTASTVLRLKDGENQVLAGLINDEDRRNSSKLPGLGEIPIVGRLFGRSQDDTRKTEIVLSITPRLIRNIRRPEAALAEFRAGTDSTPRNQSIVVRPTASNTTGISGTSPIENQPNRAPSRPSADAGGNPAPVPASGVANSAGAGAVAVAVAEAAGVGVAPAAGTQLLWSGPTKVRAGETFGLQLIMQSSQPVTSIPMAIGFDRSKMTAVSVTEGDFLKQGGGKTDFASRIDPEGQVLVTVSRSGDAGATGSGVVSTINFRASSPVDATRVQLLTVAPISINGQQLPAVPPPPYAIEVQQ